MTTLARRPRCLGSREACIKAYFDQSVSWGGTRGIMLYYTILYQRVGQSSYTIELDPQQSLVPPYVFRQHLIQTAYFLWKLKRRVKYGGAVPSTVALDALYSLSIQRSLTLQSVVPRWADPTSIELSVAFSACLRHYWNLCCSKILLTTENVNIHSVAFDFCCKTVQGHPNLP